MSANSFGSVFRLTTYGESHGPGLGGIVEGCPAGVPLCAEEVQAFLDERRPGPGGKGGAAGTGRNEADAVELLSGVFEGKTTGTPIAFHIANTDHRSADYGTLAESFRPGHADLGFTAKYGFRDYRGGGRSSGRETASRVAGGAIASAFLKTQGVSVCAYTAELGGIPAPLTDIAGAAKRPYFCPDEATVPLWEERINSVRAQGDTLGGLVRISISGVPAGLGEPVFDKLDAMLAHALMSVGAVKGVEIGSGFAAARLLGSENNDALFPLSPQNPENTAHGVPFPAAGQLPSGAAYGFGSNHAGGILGGISSGAPIEVTVAVKPIPSIAKEQQSITADGKPCVVRVGGRHDICAIPRIVPVLRSMAALVLADMLLLARCSRLEFLPDHPLPESIK